MGAEFFTEISYGTTAEKAFNKAVKDAQWENGHGGYTGSIAEKNYYFMISEEVLPADETDSFVDEHSRDERIEKWGPAACVEVEYPERQKYSRKKKFLFFGWASS